MAVSPLLAVDIGNHRVKVGWFSPDLSAMDPSAALPQPSRVVAISEQEADWEPLASGLSDVPRGLTWWIGSVNRPVASRLREWLRQRRPEDAVRLLAARDLPVEVAVENPQTVGIDRLLDAVAANRLRQPGHLAVVVGMGSAITVNRISAHGAFQGGAILPGLAMAARALKEFTDLLPQVDMSNLSESPPALGTATVPAIRAGVFWGAVGAIREIVARLSAEATEPTDVFLTGGAAPAVAAVFGEAARHVPHLTLAGIALAAWSRRDATG